ncbi:MAG: helix-turn-helix domain-containing protein [Eggerthellaceae bacterium]|nr:helix-turn-helix domain-containing protein [Eggerthellaceae bacterium]
MEKCRRHIDFEDRKFIESCLDSGLSQVFIARKLGMNPTSIAREVKRNSSVLPRKTGNSITCKMNWRCVTKRLCREECAGLCKDCRTRDCTRICDFYVPSQCPNLESRPHVCNACGVRKYRGACRFVQVVYRAHAAQQANDARASDSRRGIDITKEELERMVQVVNPLIRKGQSLEHIWATHPGQFPVTARTYYSYIDKGIIDICSLELPRKVRYKKRKSKAEKVAASMVNPVYDGRRYEDLTRLGNPAMALAVQMDCVEGMRGSRKVILTLTFTKWNYQIMMLLPEHTLECAAGALDRIERTIGLDAFKEHFPYLLTDHGHEFNGYGRLEKSCTTAGQRRCTVFYCDPNRPDQKGSAEKNHVELRKLLPKKMSFKNLDEDTVMAVCSHVNSHTRGGLAGAAPIEAASGHLPVGLMEGLGIIRIPPEEVVMRHDKLDLAVEIWRATRANKR